MITKNKSYYKKFSEWWINYSKDKSYLNKNPNDILYIIFFWIILILIIVTAEIWRPIGHYYFPEFIPPLDGEPYTP